MPIVYDFMDILSLINDIRRGKSRLFKWSIRFVPFSIFQPFHAYIFNLQLFQYDEQTSFHTKICVILFILAIIQPSFELKYFIFNIYAFR